MSEVLHYEAVHRLLAAVARKAEVAYLALFLHLQKELGEAGAVIEILVNVQLAHVVIQIEVKIVSLALLELLIEDLLVLAEVGQIVSRELACQIEAAPVVFRKSLSDDCLAVTCMIAPCGVEIVDTVRHSVIDHLLHSLRIRSGIITVYTRQSHAAKAEARQFQVLKIVIIHVFSLSLSSRDFTSRCFRIVPV